jgi:hypothetical protein
MPKNSKEKTITFPLTDDRLASAFMLTGDELTFSLTKKVSVGELIAVRNKRTGGVYVGFARRLKPYIRIETDNGNSHFQPSSSEILGTLAYWDAFPELDCIEVEFA